MRERKNKIDRVALDRALSGSRMPAALTREGRVALIVEVADALLAGRLPRTEAALFVGGSLQKWLQDSGDLVRDYFQVTKAKSHYTPSAIFRQHFSETSVHPDEGRDESSCE